jgi:hypothetical protein
MSGFVGGKGKGAGLRHGHLASRDTDTQHVAIVIVFAPENSVPLQALEFIFIDLSVTRSRASPLQEIRPHVEPVFARLEGFDRI